jgi:8-oxo-dGTP pyrophosphatase MutT (NUDIX family)
MFKYCPSCADTRIEFDGIKFHCPGCGFTYYHNTAAASGCVIQVVDKVVLLVRGKEPSLGKLDLPGGFADPGEGILEGLRRELKEELGWEPTIPKGSSPAEFFTLFASFPNTYPYKNILYNTCDMFFTISVPDLSINDLHREVDEIAGIRFVRLEEIDPNDLAFDSTRRAMAAFMEHKKKTIV